MNLFSLILITLILIILNGSRFTDVWRWNFYILLHISEWSLLTKLGLLVELSRLTKLTLVALKHFMEHRWIAIKILGMTNQAVNERSNAIEEILPIDNLIRFEVDFVERSDNLSLKYFLSKRTLYFLFIVVDICCLFTLSNHLIEKFRQIYLFFIENTSQLEQAFLSIMKGCFFQCNLVRM